MPYTLEIAGRPTAIVGATNEDAAEGAFEAPAILADLETLETQGEPLWNGSDELFVRPSFPDEVATFERTFAKAVIGGDANRDDEDGYVVFLVPIDLADEEDPRVPALPTA